MTSEKTFIRNESGARDVQLFIAPPQSDESISSCMDRASGLWGIRRGDLARHLVGQDFRRLGDIDSGSGHYALTRELERAMSLPENALASLRAQNHETLVSQRKRTAYCPLCLVSDIDRCIQPYFRLDWARVFLTHCPVHSCPLFPWKHLDSDGGRRLPHLWYFGQLGALKLPDWFHTHHESALKYSQAALPKESAAKQLWQGLVQFELRLLSQHVGAHTWAPRDSLFEKVLMDVMTIWVKPRHGDTSRSPAAVTPLKVEDASVLAFRPHVQDIESAITWKSFRSQLADLPNRRTVLILAAHTLGMFSSEIILSNGNVAPPGDSPMWRGRLARLCGSEKLVDQALAGRLQDRNLARGASLLKT